MVRSTPWLVGLLCATVGCGPGEALVSDLDGRAAELPSEEGTIELSLAGAQLQWPALRDGDTGPTVAALQHLLRGAGQDLAVDGELGPRTATAVRNLGLSLPLTSAAWARLTPTLRRGSEGEAVRAVQTLLRARASATLSVTGLLGPTTEEAIRSYQRGACLGVDGEVGPFTWQALVAGRSQCDQQSSSAGLLLAQHRAGVVTLWNETFGRADGADPLSNITDAAAGQAARTSCHGGAPCNRVTLQPAMLNGLLRLRTRYGHSLFITTVAGGAHSPASFHYRGRAFDLDEIDGVRVYGDSARARQLMAECRALGAVEVLGPSNDPGHFDHVHCAF